MLEYERRLDGRSWNPAFRWRERRAALLTIEATSGVKGVGEAWTRYAECEPVLQLLAETVPRLLGRRIDDRSDIADVVGSLFAVIDTHHTAAVSSAVEITLSDLVARDQGVPLWKCLGGSAGIVRVYASGGLYRDATSDADLAKELRGYVDRGSNRVKMKIGALDPDVDFSRVHAVREAIGSQTSLWVDAVNQLAVDGATEQCAALARLGVEAIQAPLPESDFAGMAQINRDTMPVIAGEAQYAPDYFRKLLEAEAATYVQFCLGLVGGFDGAAALDAMAQAYGCRSTPMCFSTAVMQAATLHYAASHSNAACAEFHCFHDHLAALAPASWSEIGNGSIQLGSEPGLGLAPITVGPQADGGTIRIFRDLQ